MKKIIFVILLFVCSLIIINPVKADANIYTMSNGLTLHINDYYLYNHTNLNQMFYCRITNITNSGIYFSNIKNITTGKSYSNSNNLTFSGFESLCSAMLITSTVTLEDSYINSVINSYNNNELPWQKFPYTGSSGFNSVDNGYIDSFDDEHNPWTGESLNPEPDPEPDPDPDPEPEEPENPNINIGELTVEVDNTELINSIEEQTKTITTLLYVSIFVSSLAFGCMVANCLGVIEKL